jgi:iron complex transport system substrate-binding protein
MIGFALAALLLLPFLAGCTPQAGVGPKPMGDSAYQFEDALGRDVTVDHPERVVALMGSFAETWLLAGGELAGVTSDALTEQQLDLPEDIPLLGAYNEPNLEAILALDPDFVLLSSETAAHTALQDGLEGAGINAAYFSVTHFADYLDMLRICTGITGRDDLYEENGAVVEAEIQSLLASSERDEPPSVLLAITFSGGIAVQSGDSMTGRMLGEIGCDNLADAYPGSLREFSLEEIITQDPDYLFVIPMGNDDELAKKNLAESIESHPAWNGLSAVQNGRYHLLPKELFLYKPNRDWANSYAYLLEVISDEPH